jgi:hypothetical protein
MNDSNSDATNFNLNVSWYRHALWEFYSDCVGPELAPIHISDLNQTADCNAAAAFVINVNRDIAYTMDLTAINYPHPMYSPEEVAFWKSLLSQLNLDMKSIADFAANTSPKQRTGLEFVDGAVIT